MPFGTGWQFYSFPEENFMAEYFVLLWSCVQKQWEHRVFQELLKSVADLEELFMQGGDNEVDAVAELASTIMLSYLFKKGPSSSPPPHQATGSPNDFYQEEGSPVTALHKIKVIKAMNQSCIIEILGVYTSYLFFQNNILHIKSGNLLINNNGLLPIAAFRIFSLAHSHGSVWERQKCLQQRLLLPSESQALTAHLSS
ncbi:uncharacterized protein F5891DRAFT_985160 [Suillus fuscotomentosus]|uniref:Uncharacterized protein n=1 Tax=Suillus fuscotomentosus TaxID=1912939 RepID=A0AAD4DUT7_9AGAM|nr:uncharacterized protein F5891DRAFT_985160 [Suillus fuscotomentosus]KAG1894272.1 hypothetical protein F5891DRAFT_985160 [Suillus fuscotomentosus]